MVVHSSVCASLAAVHYTVPHCSEESVACERWRHDWQVCTVDWQVTISGWTVHSGVSMWEVGGARDGRGYDSENLCCLTTLSIMFHCSVGTFSNSLNSPAMKLYSPPSNCTTYTPAPRSIRSQHRHRPVSRDNECCCQTIETQGRGQGVKLQGQGLENQSSRTRTFLDDNTENN